MSDVFEEQAEATQYVLPLVVRVEKAEPPALTDALETAAFTIFLYARMLGCAAEIDDHINRGRNMDTRTVASACRFVA